MGSGDLPVQLIRKPTITTSWKVAHQKRVPIESFATTYVITLGAPDELNPRQPYTEV